MTARHRLRTWAITVVLVTACTPTAPQTTPTAASAPAAADARPIALNSYGLRGISNAVITSDRAGVADQRIVRMVHAALYRYDASLVAVPDLASAPCDVGDDLVTITCTLRPASFHDGTPVTASDVAYEYELANSEACPEAFIVCLVGRLQAIEAVDERTIRFVLREPYAPFLSSGLADIFIEPRAQIENAYSAFAEKAAGANPADLRALAQQLMDALAVQQQRECESALESGERMLRDLGIEPPLRELFVVPGGAAFDACAYGMRVAAGLRRAASSLETSGTDAVAAIYRDLPFATFRGPTVGAGPWRIAKLDAVDGLTLARHDAYHLGTPATPEIRVRTIQESERVHAALADGSLDWLPDVFPGEDRALRDIAGIRFAEYPAFLYGALQYNVREGQLFADRNLRQAMALCIDKGRIGETLPAPSTPIYSPIPPGSWAYQPGLERERDVEAGRSLIEASGWTVGSDGIYERDGQRLAAEVVLRGDFPPPMAIVDRVAAQVRDCGIELTPRPVPFEDALTMIQTPPHLAPGSTEPFVVYFGGWVMGYDPDVTDLFHSTRIPSEAPAGLDFNYIGFANRRVDALLEEGLRTYDTSRRAEIYRELQRVLDEEQPYLFMNAMQAREPIDADLTSTAGELDLGSPQWWWQLETLLNPAE